MVFHSFAFLFFSLLSPKGSFLKSFFPNLSSSPWYPGYHDIHDTKDTLHISLCTVIPSRPQTTVISKIFFHPLRPVFTPPPLRMHDLKSLHFDFFSSLIITSLTGDQWRSLMPFRFLSWRLRSDLPWCKEAREKENPKKGIPPHAPHKSF